MSEPTLHSPSAKRIVELQDEIDRLNAKMAELQPKANVYPRLVSFLHDIDRGMRHQDAAMKSHRLLEELGELK